MAIADEIGRLAALVEAQARELQDVKASIRALGDRWQQGVPVGQLTMLEPHFRRNALPNDSAALQKHLMLAWRTFARSPIDYQDLLESGFRVFSQNDEDGTLLRLLSHLGSTNRCVVEIGSNCAGSDIDVPENLSTNLIVNHGWHGEIFELDAVACSRIRHFFARHLATKHFHFTSDGAHGYFSPRIHQGEIRPENVQELLGSALATHEPDLLVIDIDGGDYAVVEAMTRFRPRIMVVEFERRFRDRHCVVQADRSNFSRHWPQSGAASLSAWQRLLQSRGYMLCAVAAAGFNAFFVRCDVADGRVRELSVSSAFDRHPILSHAPESFWLNPNETWTPVAG